MNKIEKIKEIKKALYTNFRQLDIIIKSTDLGVELEVLISIYNLKDYMKRKIEEISSNISRI